MAYQVDITLPEAVSLRIENRPSAMRVGQVIVDWCRENAVEPKSCQALAEAALSVFGDPDQPAETEEECLMKVGVEWAMARHLSRPETEELISSMMVARLDG